MHEQIHKNRAVTPRWNLTALTRDKYALAAAAMSVTHYRRIKISMQRGEESGIEWCGTNSACHVIRGGYQCMWRRVGRRNNVLKRAHFIRMARSARKARLRKWSLCNGIISKCAYIVLCPKGIWYFVWRISAMYARLAGSSPDFVENDHYNLRRHAFRVAEASRKISSHRPLRGMCNVAINNKKWQALTGEYFRSSPCPGRFMSFLCGVHALSACLLLNHPW